MAWLGSKRNRFFLALAIAFLVNIPSYAGINPVSAAPIVKGIVNTAVTAFALLMLFTLAMTARFLMGVFSEWSKARKNDHGHTDSHEKTSFLPSLTTWIASAFALVSVLTLLVAYLMMSAEKSEPASLIKTGGLIIRVGVTAFGLLILYTALHAVLSLFKSKDHGESHDASGTPVSAAAGDISLNPELTRRSFLSLLGWAWMAFTAATLGALTTCLRFAFPNVTFEPPSKFKVGFPNQFGNGVDNRFKDQYRVWIVRNEAGFYALSTICTHLGCTPNWLAGEEKFKCPCHGSGYYITGVNFEGPAPRPLERFKITLADDGQIEIDQLEKFQEEKGDWGKPGSFLEYRA